MSRTPTAYGASTAATNDRTVRAAGERDRGVPVVEQVDPQGTGEETRRERPDERPTGLHAARCLGAGHLLIVAARTAHVLRDNPEVDSGAGSVVPDRRRGRAWTGQLTDPNPKEPHESQPHRRHPHRRHTARIAAAASVLFGIAFFVTVASVNVPHDAQ